MCLHLHTLSNKHTEFQIVTEAITCYYVCSVLYLSVCNTAEKANTSHGHAHTNVVLNTISIAV